MAKRSSPTTTTISARQARLLLLGAQGLLDDPVQPCRPAALRKRIERMGFVQLDTISTIERAHHLILHSRFDDYEPSTLATLHEKKRALFEQFTHDASYVPTTWLRYWLPRFDWTYEHPWWEARRTKEFERVVDHVLQRLTEEGPLTSRDFAHERDEQRGGWWDWKPAKTALEYLWRIGKLAIARRVNFQKVYDLMERVHPEIIEFERPGEAEVTDWACTSALERLIVATPAELAGFWNTIKLPAARQWCKRAVAEGRVVPATVEPLNSSKPKPGVALPDWQKRCKRLPEAPDRARFLAPFDPVLRDRDRALRLFNFDYRFEAFTPAKQRRFGYYVLPLLHRDQLVGRADMKTHRDRGELVVNHLYWEPGVRVTKRIRSEMKEALERLSALVGADCWSIAAESVRD
ncbi:MAG: winged helix-turn-helix domain-containing protein [Phycisphaerales bacterium JB038]